MKYICTLLFFVSCSSIKIPDSSGDGVLDKAMRNEECGLFDQFYNGCKKTTKVEPPASKPSEAVIEPAGLPPADVELE